MAFLTPSWGLWGGRAKVHWPGSARLGTDTEGRRRSVETRPLTEKTFPGATGRARRRTADPRGSPPEKNKPRRPGRLAPRPTRAGSFMNRFTPIPSLCFWEFFNTGSIINPTPSSTSYRFCDKYTHCRCRNVISASFLLIVSLPFGLQVNGLKWDRVATPISARW